jgi:AraC family transcriptional regulator
VTAFVEGAYTRDVTLAELAEVAGMSQYHFARLFKASTGLAPHQYVVRRRIEEARRLLERADVPVAQVGFEVGYESQGYFTTLFKREVGVTPAAYRRERG